MGESTLLLIEDQAKPQEAHGGYQRLASAPADPWIDPVALQDTDALRQFHADRAKRERAASYAKGVLAGIERLLAHRLADLCANDEPFVWLSAASPYLVEVAEITGRSAYLDGLRWVRRWLPSIGDETGLVLAISYIHADVEARDEAVAKAGNRAVLRWLPGMAVLQHLLRPTWNEVTTLALRGWPAADRPADEELRARKTDLQRDRRRERGVRPRSMLTKTKVMIEVASRLDLSLATVKRKRNEPDIAALIRELSEPNLTLPIDPITVPQVWLMPDPANDDEPDMDASQRAALAAIRRRCGSTPDASPCRKAVEALATRRTTLAGRMHWQAAANDGEVRRAVA